MTWGELRFAIQTSAPGVSLDLIDEWLNSRYQAVLAATDWTGLTAHATIQTLAAYQSVTDTVTLTIGSAAVTGSGTTWSGAITGRRFYKPGDTPIYTATYVSATSLTLDRPYEGNGSEAAGVVHAASAYVFMQHIYALPADCRSIETILNPVNNLPMNRFSKDGLDRSVGSRATVGDPQSFAAYDDSPEASPPVLSQLEFYPPPLRARGYSFEYIRNAILFDGQNTGDSPLPFVSQAVLLSGVRSDVQLHLKDFIAARGYKAEFDEELMRLLKVEHQQKRTITRMAMAPRFTRHRLERASRAIGNSWRGGQPGGPN